VAALRIRLLGGFEASYGSDATISLTGRKTQALLAYLALPPGEPRAREKLTALLWSDRGEEQARSSLRQALSELRKALGDADPQPLIAGRDAVSLDADAVDVDAVAFERLIGEATPEALAQAVEIYQGELLDGLGVDDPAFEEWLRAERQRLHERAREAMTHRLDQQMTAGEADGAIATARRLLALDPLQEAAHRALMRLYADGGDRTLALKQYQACRDVLQADLGVEPAAETARLHEEIRRAQPAAQMEPPDAVGEPDRPAAPLTSESPSIAVLPFVNMSGDAEQEYFSDGITEDIITALAHFRDISVIARNSSFAFKGQSPDVAEIGRKLGVQYLVEGSVRKAGGKVRITAQLVDASTGVHIWAHRYDRDLEDIFAVQDEVTETVVGTLAGRLETAGVERARKKPTTSLTAFDYLLQGRKLVYRYNREDNAKARELLEKAIELDPDYAEAHAWLSETYMTDWDGGWARDPDACLERGTEIAERAVALDDSDSRAHSQMGWVLVYRRRYEQAWPHIERALALNPHEPDMMMVLSFYEFWSGNPEAGLAKAKEAMRLDPFGRYGVPLGIAHYSLRNYEDAVTALNTVRAKLPMVIAWRAASYARLGQDEQARLAAEEFVEVASAGMAASGAPLPESWLEFLTQRAPYKRREDMDHYLDGLREAGLT
jgi:TolB-like protein/Tfp pilus assembly protein PilF